MFNHKEFETALPHFILSDHFLHSNGCVQKWNRTVTGEKGRILEEVDNVDQCSIACKDESTCEVFLFEEEGRTCTLFSGNATIVEQSGNGTVGYCLAGKMTSMC